VGPAPQMRCPGPHVGCMRPVTISQARRDQRAFDSHPDTYQSPHQAFPHSALRRPTHIDTLTVSARVKQLTIPFQHKIALTIRPVLPSTTVEPSTRSSVRSANHEEDPHLGNCANRPQRSCRRCPETTTPDPDPRESRPAIARLAVGEIGDCVPS
jgi:hypothetical protein